jgi:hypothetical protein
VKISVENGGKSISWIYNGKKVLKCYQNILMGYEVLPDDTGVLILEPYVDVGSKNAVIFNFNGCEYWRLPYPSELGEGICFDRVGSNAGELKVFAIVSNRDFGLTVDWKNRTYNSVFAAR